MAFIDLYKAREELVVFLRNSDIFTTTERAVTTVTEEFNGDGIQTDFTLTNTPVRNVRTVTVGGASQSLGDDYTVNYQTATVSFTNPPSSGTNNVDIQYDHGATDKIYPDFPREDLTLESFPRIGVDIIDTQTTAGGFGNVHESDHLISVIVQDKDTAAISNYGKAIRQAFIQSRNDFFYLRLIVPASIGPIVGGVNKNDKITQQNFDFRSIFNYEIN